MTRMRGAATPIRSPGFSSRLVAAIDEAKILGVRAGATSAHRFIGVWPVVVEGRVFARSWTLKPDGWYHAFLEDPFGVIQVAEREVRVRAVPVRSEKIRDAVEDAYARKYPTPGSAKYVRGFRTKRRRDATIEFLPRAPQTGGAKLATASNPAGGRARPTGK